jgi:hypothetical protein
LLQTLVARCALALSRSPNVVLPAVPIVVSLVVLAVALRAARDRARLVAGLIRVPASRRSTTDARRAPSG